MSKWTEWHGGEQPIEGDKYVAVKLRDGSYERWCKVSELRWEHADEEDDDWPWDIVSYKVIATGKDKDMTGWIEWDGGECPVPDKTKVLVRRLNGTERKSPMNAEAFEWRRERAGADIVAYKVVEQPKEKEVDITMEVTPEEDEAFKALDKQVGGAHYKDLAIQPIEYIHANRMGYCEANVVKYISRWRAKGGKQDLEKVKHYVDLLIQLEGL